MKIKPCLFRPWIVGVMVGTVLLNMVLPLGTCWCEDCHCKKPEVQTEQPGNGTCCADCKKTEGKKCCDRSLPETPCRCRDIPKIHATMPVTVTPIKKSDAIPPWFVSAFPVGSTPVLGLPSYRDSRRGLLPPHVPLYILLSVFLN